MKKNVILALLLALALVVMSGCAKETPVAAPTAAPTEAPTAAPTAEPTEAPTAEPTEAPTAEPTEAPTAEPTEAPTAEPMTLEETAEQVPAADGEEDAVLGTAYNGEITVTRSEVAEEFDAMLASYISYYAQYGYEMDEYDTELQRSVAEETVYTKLSEKVALRYAQDNGFVFTDDLLAQIEATAQVTMDNMREYYTAYLTSYGFSGEELTKIVDEEIAATGYTMEYLVQSGKLSAVLEYIYELHTGDITVTPEEVRAAFDAKVETAKTTYADREAFINDCISGTQIYYVPEGLRKVQVIYMALSEGDAALLAEATPSEATPSEATPAEATPSEPVDPATLRGLAKARAVKALLDGGADFTQTMFAYNEEGTDEAAMLAGYPVYAEAASYSDEFLAAAMSLNEVGEVSDVIPTSYGYFILHYAEDMAEGAPDYASIEAAETEALLTEKKNTAYSAAVDALVGAAGIEMKDMSPLYHVYVPQVIEAVTAYASVDAQTALTDMPAGDTVATLSAGATMDIMGRVAMDGEEYAFVAIPGTAFKGYVNVNVLRDTSAEEALAADNAALTQAVAVEGKKPTFTITMNDGSLIYGELYPEIAPESVGNFIELANQNYYDGIIFHRVIAGFMIQGGDPTGTGTGGPGYAIKGEFASNGVENSLSHTRGVLSMARSAAKDSAGSQFFIMHADSDHLDGEYAAFGMVLGGIETVDLIASQPTNSNDRPMTDQTMRNVYVETYGQTYGFTKLED